MKNKTLEEIEDEIKSIGRKRDNAIIDVDSWQKKLEELMEMYYDIHPDYVKVNCIICGGKGYIQSEDKKITCRNDVIPQLSCNGKGYMWMKLWKDENI